MRKLIPLFAILALVGCKKDKTPVPIAPAPLTKWDVLPGEYKVYDTLGNYLYDLQINHITGLNIYGGRWDSLQYINFDDNYTFAEPQYQGDQYENNLFIGTHVELHDSVDNRWNLFDYGCYANDVFNSDSIVFKFRKWNTPYWMNDGTTYFDRVVKHIAVRQH